VRNRLPAHRNRENLEYRYWTQGVTFVTRMDYLAPFFNETCTAGVEKLLGITDEIPERVNVIRVMMMELNRISSHLVALATGGMELGAMTPMFTGFKGRESFSPCSNPSPVANEQRYIRPAAWRKICRQREDRDREASSRCEVCCARWAICSTRTPSGKPAPRTSATGPDRMHALASPARSCDPPDCRTTCARANPIAATKTTNST